MADYNISAEITANTSGFESGVKKAQASSKKLSKSIASVAKGFGKSGLTGAISSAGLALGGIGLAIGVAVKAVKGITKALDECAEAYKVQLNAERALDTAISNSPYVTGSASKSLKEFASEMQKVSNMGDEELIPFMTQLIASGRTEAETMKIIKTASDMASSGAMSFDTAVTQLNATLNGNVGRLGQQNAELKALSEEELKNGKAVDILAEKYKGLTEATVDTKKQLKNAIGDLKESFGKSFEDAMTPMRKFFTELVQGWADARKAREEYEGARKAVEGGTATGSQIILYYEQQIKYIQDEKKLYEGMYGADLEYAQAKLKELELEENKYKSIVATEKYRQKQEAEGLNTDKSREELEEKIATLKDEYLKKVSEQELKWKNIVDVTGEEVKNEEKIKFYQDSLVDLMTQAGGEITTNNQLFKDQVAIIERLQKTINPEGKETSNTWVEKIREQSIARLEAEKESYSQSVDLEKTTAIERYEILKSFNDKIYELKKEQLEAEKEQALKSVENYANAEEEKNRIVYYYQNELYKLGQEYSTQFEKAGEKAGMSFGEGFSVALAVTKKVMSKVVDVVKKAISIISKIVNTIGNAFKNVFKWFENLFKFDPSKSLDDLLAFEDSVLTFFVETLPQLPYFFESALQSVFVLLSNISEYINSEQITGAISGIIDAFVKYMPDIMDLGMGILEKLLDGFKNAIDENQDKIIALGDKIIDMIDELFDTIVVPLIDSLMPFIEKVINALFPKIVEVFIKLLPELLISLVKGLVNSLKTIVSVLLKALPDLVGAILDVIETLLEDVIPQLLPELITAISEVVKLLVEHLPKIIELILTLVSAIVSALPPVLNELLPQIIDSLLTVLPQIVVAVLNGITTLIANLTTSDIWNLISAVGEMILQIATSLITFLPNAISTLLGGLADKLKEADWENVKNAFSNTFDDIGEKFKSTWNDAIDKVKKAFTDMADSITNTLQAIWDFIQSILNGIKSVGQKAKEVLEDSKLVQGAKAVGEAVSSGAKTAGGWVAEKATSAWEGITSLFKHANGTNDAPRGLSLVGEAGPELVRFNGGEQVLNARNTQKAIEGISNGSSIFNVTFNNTQDTTAFAMMKQLKSYQRNLAFNGVL